MVKPSLSVIIPCKNEEAILPVTLNALVLEKKKYGLISEIILVDNLSTDKSLEIAKQFDVVSYSSEGTISTVRNYGASKAMGDFLCFIDADVEVVDGWSKTVKAYIDDQPIASRNTVWGNTYGIRLESKWVERTWWKYLVGRRGLNYINGGNMIINIHLFKGLGGFDDLLTTGEDVDFCSRASHIGAMVQLDTAIETIHHGYPKTVVNFFKRERWLGLGQIVDIKNGRISKASVLAIMMLMLPLFFVLMSICFNYLFALIFILFIYIAFLLATLLYFKIIELGFLVKLNFLFIVYGIARAQALVDILFSKLKGG